MNLSLLLSWLSSAITFGSVILFGCLGETLNEKAGGLNLGTPGIMMLGGIGAVIATFIYERYVTTPITIIAILVSFLGSALFAGFGGLIYSLLTISLKCNQNVTGLTLTIFGSGVANFFGGLVMTLSGGVGQVSLKFTSNAFRTRIPYLSSNLGIISKIFFNYGFMIYFAIVLAIILNYLLHKTRFGLNLRSVGENPATADACGINVIKYKYFASITGAIISGFGGLYYSMDYVMGTWNNDSSIEALGWLALALVIFSSWKPLRSIWGSYLFGLCNWVYLYMPSFISKILADILNIENINFLQNLYKAIPYLMTILVLIIISKGKSAINSPSALGLSYFKEDR